MSDRTVLIVDDEDFTRDGLAKIFTGEGFLVKTAHNGESALSEIKKKKFDLVITDLKMDDVDGIELTRRIKKKNPAQQVIIMTAYGDMNSYLEAINLGSFDYINKPFAAKELMRIVNKIFDKMKKEEFDTT